LTTLRTPAGRAGTSADEPESARLARIIIVPAKTVQMTAQPGWPYFRQSRKANTPFIAAMKA
jgi:hypothetical protein